ncbi:ABC transporter ATP-binding protein [Haloarchaeobius amylolyticus]|uniref:ABC transporter ATP-binding protein n=1 Tax=Haloarchaeobius amylolyticus TaxID=1198296 RepID=UPI00226D9468|nr:ABC transporter ATP-binding protein [Haloarchaeobius amylolyticus]
MSAITVSGLTKDYGEVLANDDVSFSVAEGEVFGYLGPNGAGKTTTIRTLMGFQSPTAGTATLLGADVRDEAALIEAKQRIGYLPANPGFDAQSTGRQILDLHASIKGDSRRDDLLEIFDPPLDRKVREYSTGNKQKLGLVQAFMHDPDLVIMDEPTSGLDPLMQQRFNEFVRAEKERGTTVFLSSHVLGEVRQICDRVGIIREGRMVTVETVADLLGRSGKSVLVRVAGEVDAESIALDGIHDLTVRPLERVASEAVVGDGGGEVATATELTFTFTGDVNDLVDLVDGYDLLELDVEEAPLEDVFMRFYGDDDV